MDAPSSFVLGVTGSFVASLGTTLGAIPIFSRRAWSDRAQRLMLAMAGGMMLGASFFSLLDPALDIARTRGNTPFGAVAMVALGLALGAFALWAIHRVTPHEHFTKGREGMGAWNLGPNGLFVLAIALHNFPEGLSVGVAYGDPTTSTGYAVTLGIAAQNAPEGLAVAAALVAGGHTRWRAFAIAALTGFVEPLGGFVGALAVSLSEAILPGALAFAAGAMLFVISGEVIPETHVHGGEQGATWAVIAGFILMMAVAVLLG